MLLSRKPVIGPLPLVRLGCEPINWVNRSRLLGVTIDSRLDWAQHILDAKKSFVNKLNLLKASRFLPKDLLLALYFKVILPSITYSLVV